MSYWNDVWKSFMIRNWICFNHKSHQKFKFGCKCSIHTIMNYNWIKNRYHITGISSANKQQLTMSLSIYCMLYEFYASILFGSIRYLHSLVSKYKPGWISTWNIHALLRIYIMSIICIINFIIFVYSEYLQLHIWTA